MSTEKRKKSEAQLLALKAGREWRLAEIHVKNLESTSERESRSVSSKTEMLTKELEQKEGLCTELQQLSIQQAVDKRRLEELVEKLETNKSELESQVKILRKELAYRMNQLNAALLRSKTSNGQLRRLRTHLKQVQDRTCRLKGTIGTLGSQLVEKQDKLTRAETEVDGLRREAISSRNALFRAHYLLCILRFHLSCSHSRNIKLEGWIGQLTRQVERNSIRHAGKANDLQNRIWKSQDKCSALQKSLNRSKSKIDMLQRFKEEVLEIIELTQDGFYAPCIHLLIRRIVSLGCPMSNAGKVITEFLWFICKFVGVAPSKIRKPSPQTVRRIIEKAGVASKLQLRHALRETRGFITGGDGTTNLGQTFEVFHLNVQLPKDSSSSQCAVMFGEVRMAANHRAETQVKGDTQYQGL
ncbi:hypothetical protein ACEPAG_7548 [Sanghuangporus baumii]